MGKDGTGLFLVVSEKSSFSPAVGRRERHATQQVATHFAWAVDVRPKGKQVTE